MIKKDSKSLTFEIGPNLITRSCIQDAVHLLPDVLLVLQTLRHADLFSLTFEIIDYV